MTANRKDNTPQDVTADSQVARLFAWRRGFNAMHLIDLGVRLGLFKAFADTPDVTAWQIADRLGLHAPYVEVWCTTAYSFELLDADEERRFRLAPFVNEILANPAHPRYLGGYVRLGTEFATEDYRLAPEAFRTGSTVPFQGRSEDFARTVAEAIAGMNLVVARRILPSLSGMTEQLNQGGAILEVGCGTGNLLLQIAKAFPNSRCTGVDIDPTGLAAAREAVEKAGLTERVQILEGDVSSAIQPETYNVVVMVEVLHEISPALRPGALRGCARALCIGGWLVIVDETYPSTLAEARHPEFLFPLQTGFEELLWGNTVPTKEEQEQLLRQAGFTGTLNRSLMGEGFTLLATQK
jgi:ubiquinone/menaquinone biosynthesis C-methylase UbiE